MVDKALDPNFATKCAWGMQTQDEDRPVKSFEEIMKEEADLIKETQMKKEAAEKKRKEEELYALQLQQELQEQEMIEKAIQLSLKEMDHSNDQTVKLADCLDVNKKEFKPTAQKSKGGKGGRRKQQPEGKVQMKYVAKNASHGI